MIDVRWTTPNDFLCLCLFSRFKFHLIPRKGPGCRLRSTALKRAQRLGLLLISTETLDSYLNWSGPHTGSTPFSSEWSGKTPLPAIHVMLAQRAPPCKQPPAHSKTSKPSRPNMHFSPHLPLGVSDGSNTVPRPKEVDDEIGSPHPYLNN